MRGCSGGATDRSQIRVSARYSTGVYQGVVKRLDLGGVYVRFGGDCDSDVTSPLSSSVSLARRKDGGWEAGFRACRSRSSSFV